jgi:hypothetical protein
MSSAAMCACFRPPVSSAMVAIVLADALRVKFGGDSLDDALSSFRAYVARHG